jgi:hypothetical protein
MSRKERDRLRVLSQLRSGQLTQQQTAEQFHGFPLPPLLTRVKATQR